MTSRLRLLSTLLLFLGLTLAQAQEPPASTVPPDPVGQVLYVHQVPADKVKAGWLTVAAKRPVAAGSAFVGTSNLGWTGLLARALERMEPESASSFSKELSSVLAAPVLHLILSEDGRAWYFYWDRGKLVDRYCSNPGRPGEVPVEQVRSWQGRPELLLPVAQGTPLSKLRSEVSITDFNAFLYSYYPEMKVERPGAWRMPADLMAMLVQVMGVSYPPAPYLAMKSQPGWSRIAPAVPGE